MEEGTGIKKDGSVYSHLYCGAVGPFILSTEKRVRRTRQLGG